MSAPVDIYPETTLDKLLDHVHGPLTLTYLSDSGWKCDLEHDRVTFSGEGNTPEEAVLEALVDRWIGDFYYHGDMGGPTLTPEQMTDRLKQAYLTYLGYEPAHEYRGEYLRGQT